MDVFGVAYLIVLIPVCWLIVITFSRVGKGAAVPLEQLGLPRPGPMTRPEIITLVVCVSTALLWIFRADIVLGSFRIPGWANLFPNQRAIHDATVAIFMASLTFLIPIGGGKKLLEWEEFKRVPWDVLILFGGGFALAEMLDVTGFSKWAGGHLSFVGQWPPMLMIVVICIVVTLLSEVASNVATASAMMPVVAALSTSIGVHPYMLMIPAVMAASSGFMLPVATAPNTIVYSTRLVRVRAMTRSGLLLDIAAAIVITALVFTIMPWAIGIDFRRP